MDSQIADPHEKQVHQAGIPTLPTSGGGLDWAGCTLGALTEGAYASVRPMDVGSSVQLGRRRGVDVRLRTSRATAGVRAGSATIGSDLPSISGSCHVLRRREGIRLLCEFEQAGGIHRPTRPTDLRARRRQISGRHVVRTARSAHLVEKAGIRQRLEVS